MNPVFETSGPIVQTLNFRGLTVDVSSDERFFNVTDASGLAVAVLTRPRVIGGERKWTISSLDGIIRAKNIGPNTCLRDFLRWQSLQEI